MEEKNVAIFDRVTQVALPAFTILGFMFTSFKNPRLGLTFNLLSEVFWFYSAWQAWKKAKQVGILITTALVTIFLIYGVINYWFLS